MEKEPRQMWTLGRNPFDGIASRSGPRSGNREALLKPQLRPATIMTWAVPEYLSKAERNPVVAWRATCRAYLEKPRVEWRRDPWWRFSPVTEALEMELDNELKDSVRSALK